MLHYNIRGYDIVYIPTQAVRGHGNTYETYASNQETFYLIKNLCRQSGNLTLSRTSFGFYGTSLLKILWEKEILLVMSNFSFFHSVFFPFGELSAIVVKISNCCLQSLSVWKSLKYVVWERVNIVLYKPIQVIRGHHPTTLNPFPNKPWFLCVCGTFLSKTLWEKEKLLVIFPQCFLAPFRELSVIFIKFEIVVCKLFQLGRI